MASLNSSDGLAEDVTYAVSINRSPSPSQHSPPCSLIEVTIANNEEYSFTYPCFSCSGFSTAAHYHNDFHRSLVDALSNAFVLPARRSAAGIADYVLRWILVPANDLSAQGQSFHNDVTIIVGAPLLTHQEDQERLVDDISGVIIESFQLAARSQRKPCTTESVNDMVMARAELKALEGEKADKDWKESGDHGCVICIEEIESVWESLKLPCSHVFHEKCLLRWLEDNHICPLCRFELPFEDLLHA